MKFDDFQLFAEEEATEQAEAAPQEVPEETAAPEAAPEEAQEAPAQITPEEAYRQQLQQGAERIYHHWMQQAEQVRNVYPGFDLQQELRSPRFARLIRSGVDIQTAFEVVHNHEIIPAAMQYAARTVEQKLASSLRAAGNRPAENGMTAQGAVMLGSDVKNLSRKDYNEICKRVARGERISF